MKDFFRKMWTWVGVDGLLHLCLCALIVLSVSSVLPIWVGILTALLVGIAKEVVDLWRHGWDVKTFDSKHCAHDLACDGIGIVIGLAVCLLWLYIRIR